jgi:AAT family amino acid transporter
VDFVSLYIEIPIMLVMTVGWAIFRSTRRRINSEMHAERKHRGWSDLVNTQDLDLYRDEHDEDVDDEQRHNEETAREKRMAGPRRILWKLYYAIV